MRWLIGALGACSALGCSPARSPLPPAPPLASAEELAPWGKAPSLAPVEHTEVRLDTTHVRLENGLGVSVSVTGGGASTSIELRVPSARDRGRGVVAAMANALRAGTHDEKGEPFFIPGSPCHPSARGRTRSPRRSLGACRTEVRSRPFRCSARSCASPSLTQTKYKFDFKNSSLPSATARRPSGSSRSSRARVSLGWSVRRTSRMRAPCSS